MYPEKTLTHQMNIDLRGISIVFKLHGTVKYDRDGFYCTCTTNHDIQFEPWSYKI